jgi:hypothetical protein
MEARRLARDPKGSHRALPEHLAKGQAGSLTSPPFQLGEA